MEIVPVPLVQFTHPLDIAPNEMSRQFHRRDHGIPPWALLLTKREEDAFHYPFPENRDGGDPGRSTPRTAFPWSVPSRTRPRLEKRLPENGCFPKGDIRVGKGDLPGDRRAAAQQEPLVEDRPGGCGPGDVADMGCARQAQQAIQRLPDPILQFLFPPEQAGFLGHFSACRKTAVSRILPGKNHRPAPGDCLLDTVHFPAALPIPHADGDTSPSRDQGHRGDVENLFVDRSRQRGQTYVDAQDRRNGDCRGKFQGQAEKEGRRDDAGPGDRLNERVDLHGNRDSPYEKGERFGDTVVPSPGEKIRDEEVRGSKRSDRNQNMEGKPYRDPLPKEEEGKEVHHGGEPREVPEALQCVTAG